MYRFLAFTWNPAATEQSLKAKQLTERVLTGNSNWQRAYDRPGLIVLERKTLGSTYRTYVLEANSGVVIGKLFCRKSADCESHIELSLGEAETTEIVRSQGRSLVEHYWGHYVLFLRGACHNTLHVLRDPTGGLPCYIVTNDAPCIFLSHLEDWASLQLGTLSINWSHVAHFFLHNRLITESTGLRDVSLLAAGQCLTMTLGDQRNRDTRRFYWDPARVSDTDVIDDPTRAAAEIRETILRCVSAWASCYRQIVLELSGGLDSSIVAAALGTNAQSNVTCFHIFTESAAGDEREYARLAAARLHYDLFEQPVTVSRRTLEQQLSGTRLASPALLGFLPESEIAKRKLVEGKAAGALFTGLGGDQLFQHGKSDLLAADALRHNGIGSKFLRVAMESSRMSAQSVWSICRSTLRYGVLRLPFDPYSSCRAPSILASDAQCFKASEYTHPWISLASGLSASKVKLIFALIDTQLFYLRPYNYADRIHPLISQPVVECCLRIPSYMMAFRGISRGLVRDSFRDRLPSEIIDRQSKGSTTNYFNILLLNNLTFVRELLLDGRLVQERVLNRAALEEELSESQLIGGRGLRPVLNAVRAEAWARSWRP